MAEKRDSAFSRESDTASLETAKICAEKRAFFLPPEQQSRERMNVSPAFLLLDKHFTLSRRDRTRDRDRPAAISCLVVVTVRGKWTSPEDEHRNLQNLREPLMMAEHVFVLFLTYQARFACSALLNQVADLNKVEERG